MTSASRLPFFTAEKSCQEESLQGLLTFQQHSGLQKSFHSTQYGIVIRYKLKVYFLPFSNYTGLWELYSAWSFIILQNEILYNFPLLQCTDEKSYFGPSWEERLSYHLRAWCYFPPELKNPSGCTTPFTLLPLHSAFCMHMNLINFHCCRKVNQNSVPPPVLLTLMETHELEQ